MSLNTLLMASRLIAVQTLLPGYSNEIWAMSLNLLQQAEASGQLPHIVS